MNKSIWQRARPHVIAIGIFLLISIVYCLPALKGLQLSQLDVIGWKGMAQQSIEFKEKHGHYPLWTNSMLSGMPAYQIAMESKHNITLAHAGKLLGGFLPLPASMFFAACVCFYILCMVFRLRSWVSILAALGYAYASYNAVAFTAGHISKINSIAYAPAFIAGLVLLARQKYIAGFLVTLLFSTLLIWQNHLQILYYTFLTAGCFAIAYIVQSFRQKTVKAILPAAGLAVIATALGLASYAIVLLPTSSYSKYSIRGGSQLPPDSTSTQKSDGLTKEYAFNWSYGISETFTLVVPRIFGGSDPHVENNRFVSELGESSATATVLSEQTGMPEEQADEVVQSRLFSPYWGDQPGTSGTVYAGAVICFLFIVGLVLYREWHLWWILGASILGILLAWGSNFASLNYFLFDNMPYYNKFRAPAMALVIPQLTMPLLAALGLDQFINMREKGQLALLTQKFRKALLITGGLFVILAALYFLLEYKGQNDVQVRDTLANNMLQQLSQGKQPTPEMEQRANQFGRAISNALKEDRQRLFGGDLLRSLLFVALAAGLLYAYRQQKIKSPFMLVALSAISFIDLIGVDLRYLSHNSYEEEDLSLTTFMPSRADNQILQDTTYYRVLDQSSGNPWLDSRAAYFHNSVGGQHPARLSLYDDLMTHQLSKGNMQVYNMLNTKYFIINNPADGQPVAQQNVGALGPCWLVKHIKYVNTPEEEMRALDAILPQDTVIMNKAEQSKIPFTPQFDSAARITLVKNVNDEILYDFEAASNQFAVFSEIYYPLGWKALIDGKEVPIAKVNYALRGLPVPAGKHTIEFRFEPRDYYLGDNISLIAGIISILAFLGGTWWLWRNYSKKIVSS